MAWEKVILNKLEHHFTVSQCVRARAAYRQGATGVFVRRAGKRLCWHVSHDGSSPGEGWERIGN